MITFFTIPKPFIGLSDTIQRNAILSWKTLPEDCEILIFGDDPSVLQFAQNHGIKCISDYGSNDYGTPLLNGIWSSAKQNAQNDLICYINSDIILFPDFVEQTSAVKLDSFFLAGRRWDVEIAELIDFNSDWVAFCKSLVEETGVLHKETGVDYFMFPKRYMPNMPAFAIGRGWWDNWIIYDFKRRKIPVIDGTEIMTIHQNHDYSHVKSTTSGTSAKGLERTQNGLLANLQYWNLMFISDASHLLINGKVKHRSLFVRRKRLYFRFVRETLIQLRLKFRTFFSSF
jgi:hypothetical protein